MVPLLLIFFYDSRHTQSDAKSRYGDLKARNVINLSHFNKRLPFIGLLFNWTLWPRSINDHLLMKRTETVSLTPWSLVSRKGGHVLG